MSENRSVVITSMEEPFGIEKSDSINELICD